MLSAVVFRDDEIGDRKPESGAEPEFFGGEKGLENPPAHIFRHTGTVVGDFDPGPAAFFGGPQGDAGRLGLFPPCCQSLGGVFQQVQNDLLNFRPFAKHRRQIRLVIPF